jgi:hypothetical protein
VSRQTDDTAETREASMGLWRRATHLVQSLPEVLEHPFPSGQVIRRLGVVDLAGVPDLPATAALPAPLGVGPAVTLSGGEADGVGGSVNGVQLKHIDICSSNIDFRIVNQRTHKGKKSLKGVPPSI